MGGGMMGGGIMSGGMAGSSMCTSSAFQVVGDVSLLDAAAASAAPAGSGAEADLEQLLARLGLGKLLPKLLENDIDSVAELRLCTEEDYKEMELSIGMRRKLLEALAAPANAATSSSAPPPPPPPPPQPATEAAASPSSSAFGFIGGGAAQSAPQLSAEQQEAALSAALRAAGSAGSSAYAQRPLQASGYAHEQQAVPLYAGGSGAMDVPSGPADDASKRAAKKASKTKEGLKAAFIPNEHRGSM